MIEDLEVLIQSEKYEEAHKRISIINLSQLNNPNTLTPFRLILLRLLVYDEKYKQALEFYEEHFNALLEFSDLIHLQAKIQLFIALVNYSKVEDANNLLQKMEVDHLDALDKLTPLDIFQKNHAAVSLFIQIGDWSKAKEVCQDNMNLAFDLENFKWQAMSSNKLGVIFDYNGKLYEATNYYQTAVDIVKKEKVTLRKHSLIRFYNNLVSIYRRRGYLKDFSMNLDIMAELVQGTENYSMIGQVQIDKGMYHYAKGELEQTEHYFLKAKEVLETYGSKYDLFFIYGAYFEYYIDFHNKREAEFYLKRIEDILIDEEGAFYRSYLDLYRGLFLKLSHSTKDRGTAMNIFETIFEGPMIDYEITVSASLNYIEIQINDLLRYDSEELKKEFLHILDKLESLANREEIPELFVQTILFRAKLAFVEKNNSEYISNIQRATKICKDIGLDYLLTQIKVENEFISQNETLLDTLLGTERSKLLFRRLEDQIKQTTSSRPNVVRIEG
jgi:tetratricopeptide (TPR) repeat protein